MSSTCTLLATSKLLSAEHHLVEVDYPAKMPRGTLVLCVRRVKSIFIYLKKKKKSKCIKVAYIQNQRDLFFLYNTRPVLQLTYIPEG